MDVPDLPQDLFLLIISYLEPRDFILCQRVSRCWNSAFSTADACRAILVQNFPKAREVRRILASSAAGHLLLTSADPAAILSNTSDQSSAAEDTTSHVYWKALFSKVATRYHFLIAGEPRCIEKIRLQSSQLLPEWCRHYPVSPWNKHLQFEDKKAHFHYPDSLWTFDDGLLVFPSAEDKSYIIYDLERGSYSKLGYESKGKILRRMRLKSKVLVIEWCEGTAYHQLNENEEVYRHFCTAYDIIFAGESVGWVSQFRNEWKFHFLGLPLNPTDRYFSVHDDIHYAIYLWQPNRSAWGEDDPIEALAIWDISTPSSYRPSSDPSGTSKPDESAEGARAVRRLSFSDLDFFKIRQRSTPTFRELALDENHVYFVEEDHRWAVGEQAGHSLPRIHKVKTTGIPFVIGPRWEDECGADGDMTLSFCERETDKREPWMAPCWRHEVCTTKKSNKKNKRV